MTRMRKLVVASVVAALAASTLASPAAAHGSSGRDRTYKVTITNLTEGQLLTPFVAATHTNRFSLFRLGRRASNGIQQLAENGGVPVLVEQLTGNRRVKDVQVAGAAPIAPGASVEVNVDGTYYASRLSLAGMLICTNDGFGGLNRIRLPRHGKKTFYGRAYDAGTELNTEAYSDLVPPCDGLGESGESDPDLAENGRVRRHRGIRGVGDLDPMIHGWRGAVIKVTVERVD